MAAEVTQLDLSDYPLPIYSGDLEAAGGVAAEAEALHEQLRCHDGVFITSPEYNSAIPPLLVNALDWVSRVSSNGGTAAAFGQNAKGPTADVPVFVPKAPIAEHDRLVQEFMAERAKLLESRTVVKAQQKAAKESKNDKAIKDAQKAADQLEKDFLTKNADLIKQMKAAEDAKKMPRPAPAPKKSG